MFVEIFLFKFIYIPVEVIQLSFKSVQVNTQDSNILSKCHVHKYLCIKLTFRLYTVS